MKFSSCLLFVVCCLGLPACSDKQEASRAVLSQQKLDFSVDDYFKAAREGNLEAVSRFLDAGMNVDATDAAGNTALLAASEAGQGHVVSELLARGANKNLARPNGDTSLLLAARQGNAQSVQSLLVAGADAQVASENKLTPLAEATLAGHASAVNLLAPHSRPSLDYALQLAAVKGKTDVIETLVSHGASVLSRSGENRTPLMYAAKQGHEEAVKLLMERGSNVIAIDDDQKTAAMLAEDAGYDHVATVLNEPPDPEALAKNTQGRFGAVIGASLDGVPIESGDGGDVADAPPQPKPLHGKEFGGAAETKTADLPKALKFQAYRERQLPFLLKEVSDDNRVADIQMLTGKHEARTLRAGDKIEGTDFSVVKATHVMKSAKGGKGRLIDVSTLLVKDRKTGEQIMAQLNQTVRSKDTFGVVKEEGTTNLYEVHPGDAFKSGTQWYRVIDVRPTQVLVENTSTKETTVLEK